MVRPSAIGLGRLARLLSMIIVAVTAMSFGAVALESVSFNMSWLPQAVSAAFSSPKQRADRTISAIADLKGLSLAGN